LPWRSISAFLPRRSRRCSCSCRRCVRGRALGAVREPVARVAGRNRAAVGAHGHGAGGLELLLGLATSPSRRATSRSRFSSSTSRPRRRAASPGSPARSP
jgi:hypothetical protein